MHLFSGTKHPREDNPNRIRKGLPIWDCPYGTGG